MQVAVIGLGAMGSRIARRLLDAGHEVVVWNRTPARAEGFPRVAATPAEAARAAEVTITMVANSTLFGMIGMLGEALRLADRLGLSRDAAYEVLAATPIAAQAERRRAALEANDYPPRFPLSLARKDADLVAGAAPELRLAQAARSWLADADDASWGERDYSAVLAWILDVADEQQDQRDHENEQQPVADRKSAYEREDDQQQH